MLQPLLRTQHRLYFDHASWAELDRLIVFAGIMEESSRPVVEGDLYTVEQRLDTFQSSHWPYESGTCVPLKVRGHVDLKTTSSTDLNYVPASM